MITIDDLVMFISAAGGVGKTRASQLAKRLPQFVVPPDPFHAPTDGGRKTRALINPHRPRQRR